jgi:hypothetical protein
MAGSIRPCLAYTLVLTKAEKLFQQEAAERQFHEKALAKLKRW